MHCEGINTSTIKASGLLARLRQAELRPTIARISILQIVGAAESRAWSADDVHRQMILRGTRTSIGTVYRAIHQLEAKGLLLREWSPSRKALYRTKPAEHDAQMHRFVCRSCARSIAFTDPELQARLQWIAQAQGFDLVAHTVAIHVDCVGCSRTSLAGEAPRILSSMSSSSTIAPSSRRLHASTA